MGAADILAGVFDDGSTMMLALLVFLATTVLSLGVMLALRRGAGVADGSLVGQGLEVDARPRCGRFCGGDGVHSVGQIVEGLELG